MEDTNGVSNGLFSTLSGLYNGAVGASNGEMTKEQELRCVHNAALDNFCLLVLKAQKVDHWVPNGVAPPVRTLYESMKDGTWLQAELNP